MLCFFEGLCAELFFLQRLPYVLSSVWHQSVKIQLFIHYILSCVQYLCKAKLTGNLLCSNFSVSILPERCDDSFIRFAEVFSGTFDQTSVTFGVFVESFKATCWLNIMTINSYCMWRCFHAGIHLSDLFRAVQKVRWLSIWSHGTTPPPKPPRVESVTAFRGCLTRAELTRNTRSCNKSCLLHGLHVTTQQSKGLRRLLEK